MLQVLWASDRKTFIVNDSKTGWLKRAISMSAGEAMSESEALTCLREHIQMYDKKTVSDLEQSSKSGQHEADEMNQKNVKDKITALTLDPTRPSFWRLGLCPHHGQN